MVFNIFGKKLPIIIEKQGDRLLIKADNVDNGVYLIKVIIDQSIRAFRIVKL